VCSKCPAGSHRNNFHNPVGNTSLGDRHTSVKIYPPTQFRLAKPYKAFRVHAKSLNAVTPHAQPHGLISVSVVRKVL